MIGNSTGSNTNKERMDQCFLSISKIKLNQMSSLLLCKTVVIINITNTSCLLNLAFFVTLYYDIVLHSIELINNVIIEVYLFLNFSFI